MKLHILSDLHLEFSQLEVPSVQADILVLAGDIATGVHGIYFAKKLSSRYKHILYVMGNHEFYGYEMELAINEIKTAASGTNIIVLDNNIFNFEGVDFIGSTLWTDFQLYSKDKQFVKVSKELAQLEMNDFNRIKYNEKFYTSDDCAKLCEHAQEFINKSLETSKANKKVVITHHCPSKKSIASKYEGSIINSAFANNLDDLVLKSDLWIHGHTHSSFDYKLGKSRVVCNPRGYSKYQDKQENNDFKINLVVEV